MERGEVAYIAVMIKSRGEHMIKAIEMMEERNRLWVQLGLRNQRVFAGIKSPPIPTRRFSGIFLACGSGGFTGYGGWPLINLIPFITIFDLKNKITKKTIRRFILVSFG